MVATVKPDLTRVWASGAPGANIEDPDVTSPGKFGDGWIAEVPPFENFNFLQQLFTQGMAHNNEQGINVHDLVTVYPIGAIAKGSDGNQYKALVEQAGNDPTTPSANWELLALTVVPITTTATKSNPILTADIASGTNVDFWVNEFAQNFMCGIGGGSLNNAASGTKDGNNNTSFGFGQFGSATSAYASSAFGFNALNSVVDGDSNTALGYQTLINLTSGKNNTAAGVDAGYNITTGINNVTIGRHVLFNGGVGAFTGGGNTMIGTDIQLNATNSEDSCIMGFNASLNGTGSVSCNIIGKAAARDALTPDQSNIIGATAYQTSVTINSCVAMGDRAVQNTLSDTESVSIGTDAFFTSLATDETNNANVGVGALTGFKAWGIRNTFIGYRTGAFAAETEINSAVLIGYRAGDGHAVDADFEINNTQTLSNALLNGNFTTRVLQLEGSKLALRNFARVHADNAAAKVAGLVDDDTYRTATGELMVVFT